MAEFAETAVLIAVMEEDDETADALLDDFMPHELREFERQVDELANAIGRARSRKGSAS